MGLQWNPGQRLGWMVPTNRAFRTDNQGFTLIQVLVALVLVLVIASIAAMAYQGLIDNARAAACENNLKVLNTAVELYADEYGVIPAVLGELKPEHLQKAYARVMENSSWQRRFSLALLEISRSGEAFGEFLSYENLRKFGAAKDSFRCPGDKNGGTSYGINANVAGTLWAKVDNDVVVVGDCDSPTFTSAAQLKKRHGSGKVAIAMTKGGVVVKMGEGSDAQIPDGVDPTFDVDAPSTSDMAAATSDAQAIIDAVLALGLSNAGVEEHLVDRMNKVKNSIDAFDSTSAVDKLRLFTEKVQTDIDEGRMDEADGNSIMDMANGLIGSLNN